MAGLVGSLAMLLERSRLGVTLDLDRAPVPDGVSLPSGSTCFPCYAFLLCLPPGREVEACLARFTDRGLEAAAVGRDRRHRPGAAAPGGQAATVFDLRLPKA